MQKNFFSEYWLYGLVSGAGRLVRALPGSWALATGRAAGTVAYWVSPKRRAVSRGNLQAAFGGERSPAELDRLCLDNFRHLGMSFVEMLLTPSKDYAFVGR